MQPANTVEFKAEAVHEHLKMALGALADANAVIMNDMSPEFKYLRIDLRDLLTGAQIASQRAEKLAPPLPLDLDDTQVMRPVQS